MKKTHFKFGENWQNFIKSSFNEERIAISQQHLLAFLEMSNLNGKTFLEIGCGSGLHSLAAWISGADQIVSFDLDPASVKATLTLWEHAGKPKNWSVIKGSVLDTSFMESLGSFDIVYSWGVLHHTGAMWDAIRNAGIPLDRNGIFYMALYSHEMYQNPSPEYWIETKKKYNLADSDEKQRMEYDYAWNRVLKPIADQGKNPLLHILEYKKSRGMDFWTDVRDWLGGYPMDFAKVRDVAGFCHKELGQSILKVVTGQGNTEFLLKDNSGDCFWSKLRNKSEIIELKPEFKKEEGFCYFSEIPKYSDISDHDGSWYRSPMMVFEDGIFLGFPHAGKKDICQRGEGRYSHRGETLLFSASDNSNPNHNGRSYTLTIPGLNLSGTPEKD